MKKNPGRNRVFVSGLHTVLLFLSVESLFSQNLNVDFGGMKGTLFTHTIIDKSDSLSSKEITELRDEMGMPLWFSRDFSLTVCLSGLCRMVHVRIYWTGAATYLGLQTPEDDQLTKTDHSKFTPEDLERLDRILSDSLSILKRLKIEDLTVETENKNKDLIDGHSGATESSLLGYVVKDAVYTCYTLWQTVYGSARKEIQSILEQRTNKDYLRLVFERKNPQYILWAIDFISKHPQYHQAFYPEIISLVKSKDINLSKYALHYLTPVLLSDAGLQKELAKVMEEASVQRKFEIIWKFLALQHVNNDIILNLLGQYEEQKLSTTLLWYVCEMIRPENMKDSRIVSKIENISKDDNLYVRNITQKILSATKN